MTLRFFATGSFYICVGDFLGCSKSSAHYIVLEVAKAICTLSPEYINMPSPNDQATVIEKFYNMARFPRVVGVIDCTHIKIQSPGGGAPEVYRNRKGWFSKNVQVVAGPDLRVMDIVTGYAGSSHDQTIFDQSALAMRFENGEFDDKLLLGDSGYECRPYILTPLAQVTSHEENLYNESLIRTRNAVERCFGVLKRRFPTLSMGIRLTNETMDKADSYIVACAILHNIACLNRDGQPPRDLEVVFHPEEEIEENIHENNTIYHPRYHVRRNLINNYFARL